MTTFKGSLTKDGNVVLSDVDIELLTRSENSPAQWGGEIRTEHHFNQRGAGFAIETADGRKRSIVIDAAEIRPGVGTVIEFSGVGSG